jgi:hypothetical protein
LRKPLATVPEPAQPLKYTSVALLAALADAQQSPFGAIATPATTSRCGLASLVVQPAARVQIATLPSPDPDRPSKLATTILPFAASFDAASPGKP